MNRISEETIKKIMNDLDAYNGTLWTSNEFELPQDRDGDILHVQTSLMEYPSQAQLDVIREKLIDLIHPNLPSYPNTISWIASIIFRGELIDSVMGGMNHAVI